MASDKPGGTGSGGIGYVLKKFPVLSETFILNELLALEARGVPVHIFSLERPNDPRFHEDLPKLKARVAYIPGPPDMKILLGHHRRASKHFKKEYYRALLYSLTKGKPMLLWRFLQSGYVANEASRLRLTHLHAHFANRPASVAFLAAKIAGIPFSFTAHATDIFKAEVNPKSLARKIEAARFVVTVSEFNKSYLEERTPSARSKIVLVHNGIDLARFSPNGVTPPAPFTILCVARLVEKKGLPVLIEASRHLRDREVTFRTWIVGKGRIRPELEALIKRWKLQEHVKLLGPHSQLEVLDRYHSSHLYALPCTVGSDGNRDGLPVSIVEALACGLPVVTTPVTGIPEVIRHGHNGLLVPSDDARSLADAIQSLIQNQDLYESLKQNTRSSVTSMFDLRETAEQLRALLQGGLS